MYTFVQLATLINSTDGNYTSRELLCLLDPITLLNVPQDEHHCLNIHLTAQRQQAPEKGFNETLYFQINSFTSALERRLKGCRCDINVIFFHLSRSKDI